MSMTCAASAALAEARRGAAHLARRIADAPVRQDHGDGAAPAVAARLAPDHLLGQREPCGERRAPAGRQLRGSPRRPTRAERPAARAPGRRCRGRRRSRRGRGARRPRAARPSSAPLTRASRRRAPIEPLASTTRHSSTLSRPPRTCSRRPAASPCTQARPQRRDDRDVVAVGRRRAGSRSRPRPRPSCARGGRPGRCRCRRCAAPRPAGARARARRGARARAPARRPRRAAARSARRPRAAAPPRGGSGGGSSSSARSMSSGEGVWPSSGSRRRRCSSASAAALRTCSSSTSSRPSSAARARAARAQHDVAAHAVDAERGAGGGDPQRARARAGAPAGGATRAAAMRPASSCSAGCPLARERLGVALEGQAPPHDLGADGGLRRADHLDPEAEAVEQLRAQLALLDVHRADEQEARVVHDGDGVALDARDAGGGRVEQRVDEVIGQQVDLVHVEDALVRAREQARLERLLAVQGATEVERADEAVEARAERQLDERGRPLLDARRPRDGSVGRELAGRERERLAARDRDGRQQRREPAHRRRLGRPALAAHEHAADLGRDRVDRAGPRSGSPGRRWP